MGKITDSQEQASKRGKRRVCYMAYTLNNTQPVLCTLVSDQPYFYMEDEHLADEDLLEAEDYAQIERELVSLKKKIDAYETMSKNFEHAPLMRLAAFCDEADSICGPLNKPQQAEGILQPADKAVAMLRESRMAKSLLDCAALHGVFLVESDTVFGARYDKERGRILIHPDLADTELCLLTIRELRRHWQYRHGAALHPLTFHPDQAILINRAQIADLSVAMIRVAWELQLAGSRSAWDYIENSGLADLGRAFAREAFVDFRSLANGKASAAVFESWFLSERCRHQDKKLIQAMLADHQGYVFACETAGRTVTAQLINALGEQPYGKNYLAAYTQMIMKDPVFNEVRDRSNANFLWFIKFERSFRETEQALQEDEDLGFGVLPGLSSQSQDHSAEQPSHGSESKVISVSFGADPSQNNKTASRGGFGPSGGSNIIHASFGNADRL